jgi:hypothetical protein
MKYLLNALYDKIVYEKKIILTFVNILIIKALLSFTKPRGAFSSSCELKVVKIIFLSLRYF